VPPCPGLDYNVTMDRSIADGVVSAIGAGGTTGAVAALERVVYLLDRTLAPSSKVRAYGNAIQVVQGLAPGELEARVEHGTLQELAGIGPSTGSVITAAVRGEVPAKLSELERTSVLPLSDEGHPYREALRGDCHTHSTWSDGGASIEDMARTAAGLGHEYLVMTDHSPRLTIAHGLNRERLQAQLDEIERLNAELEPFRILTGIEVDILEDGSLDGEDDMLDRLDIVVASVHSKLSMDTEGMTRRMVLAAANPQVDILGHLTGRKLRARVPMPGDDPEVARKASRFDSELVFAACARFDTAVEINCRPERQDPPDDLLALALEWGCRVSIDTDAHATGQLEWQVYGCDKAARHRIAVDRIVNTMPAGELVEWAAAHPAG
jgi:putative hydrolase